MKRAILCIILVFVGNAFVSAQTDNSKRKPRQTNAHTSAAAKQTTPTPAKQNNNISQNRNNGTGKNKDTRDSNNNDRTLSATELRKQIIDGFNSIISCQKTSLSYTVQYIDNQYKTIVSKLTQLRNKVPTDQQETIDEVLSYIKENDGNKSRVEKVGFDLYSPTIISKNIAKRCRDLFSTGKLTQGDNTISEQSPTANDTRKTEINDAHPRTTTKTEKDYETMAYFPGGDDALYQWLYERIKYPEPSQKLGIQGRVLVKFAVEKDGSIGDVEVIKSPDEYLSKEAIRVIKMMPKWIPATDGNKPVRSYFNLPIMFRLS